MAITTLTDDLNILAALDDEPNDVGGLTPEQAKAKFDEAGNTIKDFVNDSLIPELDAAHLPYEYGGANSIKDTLDGVVLGTIPDDSLTFEKIASTEISSEADAQAGTASDKLMTPQRTLQAIVYKDFPVEVLTATWNESIAAGATATKAIAHTLGVIPSRVDVFFRGSIYYAASVNAIKNGENYSYSMAGPVRATYATYDFTAGGSWVPEMIVSGYLFGQIATDADPKEKVAGTYALGAGQHRLGAITFSSDTISFPITNADSSTRTLTCSVVVRVYA